MFTSSNLKTIGIGARACAVSTLLILCCQAAEIQFAVSATIPSSGSFNYPNPSVAAGATIVSTYTFDENAVGTPFLLGGILPGVSYPLNNFTVDVLGVGSLLQSVSSKQINMFYGSDLYAVNIQGIDAFGNFTTWQISLQGNGPPNPLLNSNNLPLAPLDLSRASIKDILSSSFIGPNRDVASYWVGGRINSFTSSSGPPTGVPDSSNVVLLAAISLALLCAQKRRFKH